MTGTRLIRRCTLLGSVASWTTPAAASLHGRDKADAINGTRQVLLTTVGGLALLTGAAFTTQTYYLSQRGQLTDRYTNVIALLAKGFKPSPDDAG